MNSFSHPTKADPLSAFDLSHRPDYDQEVQDVADYVLNFKIQSKEAWNTARLCLMDTLGCGLLALGHSECTKYLGPLVEGTFVPNGARVPGTDFRLDPVKAAWDIGCIIRWLDYNDTWLAAEWGHPSDNLGAILAVADHVSQLRLAQGDEPLTMHDVLECMIMAHEIQGIISLENSFHRIGLCHVLLVRVASAAVVTKLMGGGREEIMAAVSQAWVDGSALNSYRHEPNTGSRKSWAAGDATSRAVRLADMSMRGEMGIPSALTAPHWGFYDVFLNQDNASHPFDADEDRVLMFPQDYGSYVMENTLFKLSYPAEFHAQTAIEAAVILHPDVKNCLAEIERVVISTHDPAIRLLSKKGALYNAADRDHCIQYMVAASLVFGELIPEHYRDSFHTEHPMLDELRAKVELVEVDEYSEGYYDPEKRSIANAVQVFFNDGASTKKIAIEYPIGHRCRRDEAVPLLEQKFKSNLSTRFTEARCSEIFDLCVNQSQLEAAYVNEFMDLFVV